MGTTENELHLNKTEIKALAAHPNGTRFYSVGGFKGLCVQVTKAGVKSFVLRYRFNGAQKIHTLGVFPAMTPDEADKAHTSAWAKINAGVDPNQAKADARKAEQKKKLAEVTVTDLAKRYISEHIPGNSAKWGKEATRLIEKHIIPAIGKLPLAKVGPADISTLLYEMKQTTPTMANRTRAVLRTMFGRAEEWELRTLGSNPVSVVKQRAPEVKRERRLTDLELKALGKTLQTTTEASTLILAIRLALLAGMRKGEIQGLRLEWVDLESGEIRIPPDSHKTGKKTGKSRVVHLCSALVASLQSTVPTLGCPYVIPGRPTEAEDKKITWPQISLQVPWVRVREGAGLSIQGDPKDEDPGLHDLRRTFASVGSDLGLKGFVGELLGHAEATVTDIYTRSAAEPLHDAAEKIGARIEGILTGKIDPEKEAEERRKVKEAKTKGAS